MMQNNLEMGNSRKNMLEKIEDYEKSIGNSFISSYYKRREIGDLVLGPTAFQEFFFLTDGEQILSHCFVDGFLDTKNCRLELTSGEKNSNLQQQIFSKTISFLFDELEMETIALENVNHRNSSIQINREYQPISFSEGVILENPKARV